MTELAWEGRLVISTSHKKLDPPLPECEYAPHNSERKFWCNTHQRYATHNLHRIMRNSDGTIRYEDDQIKCNPKLGGITYPCDVVDITDILEIDD